MHETTIYINELILNEIFTLSQIINKSSCYIIKYLINKAIGTNNSIIVNNCLTEYQASKKDDNYKIFHYRLNEVERIKFHSARLCLNISISKLLLIGFLLYFRKLIDQYSKKTDSNNFNRDNYSIIKNKFQFTIFNFLIKLTYHKLE